MAAPRTTFSAALEAIRNRQTIRNQWQGTQPHSGGIENSIRNGRSQPDHGTFPRPRRWKIFAVEQDSLKHGNIAEAWHAIFRHPAVQNLSVLEFNRFEKRAAQSLNIGSFDLIAQIIGIHNCAALKRGNHANYLHVARLAIDVDLGEG